MTYYRVEGREPPESGWHGYHRPCSSLEQALELLGRSQFDFPSLSWRLVKVTVTEEVVAEREGEK